MSSYAYDYASAPSTRLVSEPGEYEYSAPPSGSSLSARFETVLAGVMTLAAVLALALPYWLMATGVNVGMWSYCITVPGQKKTCDTIHIQLDNCNVDECKTFVAMRATATITMIALLLFFVVALLLARISSSGGRVTSAVVMAFLSFTSLLASLALWAASLHLLQLYKNNGISVHVGAAFFIALGVNIASAFLAYRSVRLVKLTRNM